MTRVGKFNQCQEKSRKLLGNPTGTISSQSLQECKAGSETNAYRPDRTMKRHENGTPLWWRRYSPNLRAIVRAKTLNGFRVTKLNSVPFTGKLETLAEFDVDNIITVALRNDESKVLDSAVAAQFKATQLKYTCIGTASGAFATRTDGTATSTCTANFNVYHLKECVDKLKTIFVPKYDGENYICLASINAVRGIKDHSDFTDAAKYGAMGSPLLKRAA